VPVWPGIAAPSGVLFAGLAFTFRDLTQEWLGRKVVLVAIVVGALLSWLVTSNLAVASGVAFLFSELADFAVYQPLRERRWLLAVAASNLVGLQPPGRRANRAADRLGPHDRDAGSHSEAPAGRVTRSPEA
jgi:queuosine precursor transporter